MPCSQPLPVTPLVSRTPAPRRQGLSHEQGAGGGRCSMRLRWGLSRVASRASVSPSGEESYKVGDSPQALPCPSSAMRPRMVSSLSLSVPIRTVGLAMAPEAHHSTWILADFANFALCSHFCPPHSALLSWRPSQDCSGPDTGEGATWGLDTGHGRRDEGNMAIPEVCHGPAAPHPTLHHPSGWPHSPCLPGEDAKGPEVGVVSSRVAGPKGRATNH